MPRYYERDERGLPARWLTMMRASIEELGREYNTNRMVREYVDALHLPAHKALAADARLGGGCRRAPSARSCRATRAVNGFSSNAVPGCSTPWLATASSAYRHEEHARLGAALANDAARSRPLIPGITTSVSSRSMVPGWSLEPLERFRSVRGDEDRVAEAAEHLGDEVPHDLLVLGDEDGLGAAQRLQRLGDVLPRPARARRRSAEVHSERRPLAGAESHQT